MLISNNNYYYYQRGCVSGMTQLNSPRYVDHDLYFVYLKLS